MTVKLERVNGEQIRPWVNAVAGLRIQVFREWPYLYDGNMNYEAQYLETYIRSPHSVLVLARDGDQVVGAATGLPLEDEEDAFIQPFVDQGYDPASIFYFGESVLLPAFRGQGIGVRFFAEREAHARQLGGFRYCCFCAVERPADHPLRPKDHKPLDDFWKNRGYEPVPALRTHYPWKDIDEAEETAKSMNFWMAELG
ncbi:GNAT family N-acetyltransferase [Salicola sp. Rm-C-2C1-2]|uniref:GNAT family N-acetyltransferase n=1 Tax=Salicola sp. Rm-C-2C1-2 TaxID=3141321 RepID=UPI0032E4CEC4